MLGLAGCVHAGRAAEISDQGRIGVVGDRETGRVEKLVRLRLDRCDRADGARGLVRPDPHPDWPEALTAFGSRAMPSCEAWSELPIRRRLSPGVTHSLSLDIL